MFGFASCALHKLLHESFSLARVTVYQLVAKLVTKQQTKQPEYKVWQSGNCNLVADLRTSAWTTMTFSGRLDDRGQEPTNMSQRGGPGHQY